MGATLAENSLQYDGEVVDLGFHRVWFRGGRVHVSTQHGPKPWLDKRGKTIYVVGPDGSQKLDIEPPSGLN